MIWIYSYSRFWLHIISVVSVLSCHGNFLLFFRINHNNFIIYIYIIIKCGAAYCRSVSFIRCRFGSFLNVNYRSILFALCVVFIQHVHVARGAEPKQPLFSARNCHATQHNIILYSYSYSHTRQFKWECSYQGYIYEHYCVMHKQTNKNIQYINNKW